ncbi:uncharacterized protein DUF222, partial [Kribbella sp. VKM Ac-2571]|uniref:HNH endonuclease signature motif containing protein n=1 Tax=Kribbella sp. VKM Ac-2571 TaxID=2512222 RepID=UPI00105C467F
MEIRGGRPVWSMSDSEKLSALDAVVAEKARLETLGQQLVADLDRSGYAKELGAGDTARLMSQRYRQDLRQTRRDVRVANLLTAYPATRAALPDPSVPFPNPAHAATATAAEAPEGADVTGDPEGADVTGNPEGAGGAEDADGSRGAELAEGDGGAGGVADGPAAASGWRVNPAQAAVIVAILDHVPATVPPENLAVAEQELIGLAATHTPSELRRAGKVICDLLDPDGPEPSEKAAYARESLTLKSAERGVSFHGFLANENAELFRTLIHAHARPHKTIDGEPDPRPHTKRQADALTTVLTTAGQTPTATGAAPTGATASSTAGAGDGEVLPFPLDRVAPDGDDATAASAGAGNITGTGTGTGVGVGAAVGAGAEAGGGAGTVTGAGGGREVVPGHGAKPHISVTIDYNDLVTATANATGALTFGDRLSAATVRRLACDADILPIVLGSRSQPLDVGTTQRLVTRPMRRALNARDKGCVVCGAPPSHCEAHHLIHWADGGITAVSNLVLLRLSHESRVGRVGLGWCEILGCGCERALWRCGSVDV